MISTCLERLRPKRKSSNSFFEGTEMGDISRSLLGHFGDLYETDEEFQFYVDPLEGLSEAEAAFRIHYRKVLDFEVSIPIDEDTMGDFVSIALKAAALRAGTKAAKIPIALVDECIDSFSDADRRAFFDKLGCFADAYSLDETAVAATFFQDLLYFSYYSRSWELIPEDIESDLCETVQFHRDFYGEDVKLIEDYKKAFFLVPDEYMNPVIEHPEKFQKHDCWDWSEDPDIWGDDDDEDDSDSFAENFAGSMMDAILADNKTDPLSSDYKPEEDDDEEEDSDSSVSYNVYWSLDPSALPPNPAPEQEEEDEDND